MDTINRQKFLAELAKLLTFMYEEDKQTALEMYNKMFDDCSSEQALLQALVSPTRQAVELARAYNANDRRLQVQSVSRMSGNPEYDDTPDFVAAIERVRTAVLGSANAAAKPTVNEALFRQETEPEVETRAVPENQISLFDSQPEEDASEQAAPAATPVEATADSLFADVPAQDEVDAFLADFTIENNELADPAAAPEIPVTDIAREVISVPPTETTGETVTVRKAKLFALIPYVLLSVPLTLVGVVLLLLPTLLSLATGVGILALGAVTISAALGGISVFADALILLGAAIILIALGLLFLWLFIWFIGGAIVGLINGVITLGGNWCYKEVAAK